MNTLRPYQERLDADIRTAWESGARNVVATAPTGAGKTVTFTHILAREPGSAIAIAHRQELVSQISLGLAREGIRHTLIAPRSVCRWIVHLHRVHTRGCYYDPTSRIAVAGVDTLIRRGASIEGWARNVGLWVMDEAHHVLRENKWGAAVELFPRARGLGVTATPCRADGKGLGRHAFGVFDALVSGPSMRELIDLGYLSDFRIFCPPSHVDLSRVAISPVTGDFNRVQLSREMERARLVGDIVEHYKRVANGKLGITFVHDVPTAHAVAAQYMDAGIPAAAVSAKTPERERHMLIERLRAGSLRQLVNVDLFGEGFDLPAIEVVSMARPTQSYPLFVQQFGRALRPLEGKREAIILDHVGNIVRHGGAPDRPRTWSLDGRATKRKNDVDPDAIPTRVCAHCTQPYEAFRTACPYCAAEYVPARRDGPEHVDGDLVELDPATLAELKQEVARIDESPERVADRLRHAGAPPVVVASAAKQHGKRQAAQTTLRRLIDVYGALEYARGYGAREAQKRFYSRFGVDVLTARTLGRPEAERLAARIIEGIRQ